jgi:hypothetical protein
LASILPAPFRAIAATVVPEAARLDEAGWAEVEAIIGRALAARPPALRRQLGALIRLVDVLAVVRHGRRFAALATPKRTALLARMQDSRLLLLRRGVWGLRTLVFMGYYARPASAAEIGYRADPRGWEARR